MSYEQRWFSRREYRRTEDERADMSLFVVERIQDKLAKAFVCGHHYSGSFPAAHVSIGLFRRTACSNELVGVAVFSEGVQSGLVMPRWSGCERQEGTELGRFVLLPEVGYNGETWFLKRAIDAMRAEKTGVRVILSYSDPLERLDSAGQLVKPGHVGTIYQASNALFMGRASPRRLFVAPNGHIIHPYNFGKVASQLRNAASAERHLVALGCPQRRPLEAPASWIERIKSGMASVRHPGNLVYVFGATREETRRLKKRYNGGLPYPKASTHVVRAAA